MSSRLICLGNVIIDVTAKIPQLPERGGDILAQSGALLTGGSGFNVMVAASRLGIPALFAGTHGSGPSGDLVRRALNRENIEIAHEAEPGIDTGWDIALTDSGAERTFITVVGAETGLTARHLFGLDASPGDVVYVSGYGVLAEPNRSAILGWLAALPAGIVVVTDPGPLGKDIDADAAAALRAATTWWSCNSIEACELAGTTNPMVAAKLLAAGGMGVIVRLGADGCLLAPPEDDPLVVPGFPIEAIDTNGAGDAHVGAFIAHLMQGFPALESARRANAAAAISVTRPGPATGPDSAVLDYFLAQRTVK